MRKDNPQIRPLSRTDVSWVQSSHGSAVPAGREVFLVEADVGKLNCGAIGTPPERA
jgi:hypothetical protein